jgi:F420-non-reducing hydrogenase small subunit
MKLNIISLACCAGCITSLLNAGEAFIDVVSRDIDLIYCPTFIDMSEIPSVDISIIEGGVRTEEDLKLVKEVRAKSKTVIALGICATHGGITSLGNVHFLKKLLEEEFPATGTLQLPELKDLMYPVCSFVDVDYYVPGCPPMPMLIIHTLKSILNNRPPTRSLGVVCMECHRKIVSSNIKRLYTIYEKEADPELCLVSQGFVCLGSLTRGGCGAPCPRVGFVCFGCRGPSDSLMYRPMDMYRLLVKAISVRTGIVEEEVKKELYSNPFVFHTFIFSKLERFRSRERII